MKNTMLKMKMPLVAATWVDALRRVCNRIALVAAAICTAAAPLSSFAAQALIKGVGENISLVGEVVNDDLPYGALLAEPDLYVQTGLIAHFDGIRNAGLGQTHNLGATTWVNLGSGGSANDATLTALSSSIPSGATDGMWTGHGYFFMGKQYFAIGGAINLDKAATVQLATEWTTSIGDCSGVNWPLIFGGSSSDADKFGIWHDKNALSTNFKVLDNKKSAAAAHWDGYFLNAVYDGANSRYSLTKNTSYNWLTGGANGSIKSSNTSYVIGTAQSSDGSKSPRMFKGIVKSVRIYDRILTTDELAWNRVIDEVRFRGFVTNGVVVVASNIGVVEGTEANGTYYVNGSHTFTAPASVTVGSTTYELQGYTLERYDDSTQTWVKEGTYSEASFAYKHSETSTGVRLTWNWHSPNEPDVYLDYVESDGRQWIDSGVQPGPTASVTPAITSMIVDTDVDIIGGNSDCDLVGLSYNNFEPIKTYNGKYSAYVKNAGETTSGVAINSGRHRVITTAVQGQPLSISVDGTATTRGTVVANSTGGNTLYLFARKGPDRYCSAKLWGLKIYINNELVRDFVPGAKGGVAGLYDRQNDEWCDSKSGTALIAGPVSSVGGSSELVAEDWTLTQDETVDGKLFVNSGVTIDLQGYKLTVNGLSGAGTITDSTSGTPGELHYVVPSGETAENTTFAFTRNMKLVVEGGGTFTASKANQTYTGGTVVSNNTTIALGTATHPLGDGNATQTVTVGAGANFNAGTFADNTTCTYNFELGAGSGLTFGNCNNALRRFGHLSLQGDASLSFAERCGMMGLSSSHSTITLNNHVLSITLNDADSLMRYIRSVDAGTIRFVSCSGKGMQGYQNTDFSSATVEYTGTAFVHLGDYGLSVGDLTYNGAQTWSAYNTTAKMDVYGRYLAATWRPPFNMMSGATLDLSGVSGTWNADGETPRSTTSSQTGRVTFLSANATYTVDIGTRTVAAGDKLVQFTDGYSPASVVFNLAATGAAQTPEERNLGIVVANESGHTYLEVISLTTPYARWVIDNENPENSGWKFYNPTTGEEVSGYSTPTSDMEVRIYSYAEYQAVAQQQGVTPLSYKFYGTIQIPSNVSEWNLDSYFTDMAEGATIDLNGKRLNVSRMNFTGTITDSTSGTPGELHLTVANGTIENTSVALTGNLKFVVEGGGTFIASKASQSYTGGTEVQAGTLTLGTATHPLGTGDATQTVTVGENATFDFNANCGDSTCSYGFILNTNSVLRMGTVGSRWNRQVSAITLLGDATYDFGTARTLALFGGGSAGETVITLNGHTLMIEAPADGDINTCNIRTVGEGTISYRSGMAGGFYPEGGANRPADFSSANVEVVGNAWMNLGNLAFIAKDFKYTSSTHK